MNIQQREESVKKQNLKIKRNGNRFLISFLIIFFSGYLFFFTSPLWMPTDYLGVTVTEHGEMIEANDREVTLISWTYSKPDRKMEVLLDINNLSLDGVERYEWSALDSKKGILKTEVITETDDFVALHISNVPRRFAEISLRMDIADDVRMQNDLEFNTIKLYTARPDVEQVERIEEKSLADYKRISAEHKIADYRKEIRRIEKDNDELSELITAAEEKKKMLKRDKKYQTEEEKLETDQKINEMQSEIEIFQSEMEKNELAILELKEKITLQKERLEAIGG